MIVYYEIMDDDVYDALMYWLLMINQWYTTHKVKRMHIGIESNKSSNTNLPPPPLSIPTIGIRQGPSRKNITTRR